MGRRDLRRVVISLTAPQLEWLSAFGDRQGYTRAEAIRELVRRAMGDPAFFVDGNGPKAHDDGAVLAHGGTR